MRRLLIAALAGLVPGPAVVCGQSYAIYGADRYFPRVSVLSFDWINTVGP